MNTWGPRTLLALALAAVALAQKPFTEWNAWGGDEGSSQFSALTQITKANVGNLQPVWRTEVFGTTTSPIISDGVLYARGNGGLIALNAATGKEIWSNPDAAATGYGITLWKSADGKRKRIIYYTGLGFSQLDAFTGKLITNIGVNGVVDLRDGFGMDATEPMRNLIPPRVYKNLIFFGHSYGPPATLRAFDVLTGKIVWTFHSAARPGEYGFNTWGTTWDWRKSSGSNTWGEMTVDEKNGILFITTAAPKPDYVGEGHPGSKGGNGSDMNLFSTSLVALNAKTGKRLWHFQMIHHDLFDLDNAQAPKLLTLTRGGKRIEAVLEAGKTGFIYTFERKTGKPIFPIEERPVPQTDAAGEMTSPTQPFPTAPPPFARQTFTAKDLSPLLSTERREAMLALLATARNEGMFTPPSERGSIEMPGNHGGGQFGTGAVDGAKGLFYVSSVEQVALLKLLPNQQGRGGRTYLEALTNRWMMTDCCGFLREGQYPVNAMPWSQLTAYDMNKGTQLWQIPFGELPELKERGYPNSGLLPGSAKTTISLTTNGLIFSALSDKKFRVFDAADGRILMEQDTTGPQGGSPAIYQVNGRQFVLIATQGVRGRGVAQMAAYTAYALPVGR